MPFDTDHLLTVAERKTGKPYPLLPWCYVARTRPLPFAVDSLGDSFQVARIDAASDEAQMVDVVSGRDGPAGQGVNKAVGAALRQGVEHAIALRTDGTSPQPARPEIRSNDGYGAVSVYPRPKDSSPLFSGILRGHREPLLSGVMRTAVSAARPLSIIAGKSCPL